MEELFIIFSLILFFWFLNDFIDFGGKNFPLLKILLESIILLFLLILFLQKYHEILPLFQTYR